MEKSVPIARSRPVVFSEITLTVLIWGASFIATKVALKEVSPITIVWLRFTIGTVLLVISTAMRKELTLPPGKDLFYLDFLGLQGITFHQWLQ